MIALEKLLITSTFIENYKVFYHLIVVIKSCNLSLIHKNDSDALVSQMKAN